MEQFKLDNFYKEYHFNFPDYSHLKNNECIKILEKIVKIFSFNENLSSLEILQLLHEKMLNVKNFNAEDEAFKFSSLLKELQITPKENVYINWYRFDDIDYIKYEHVAKYFEEIWYPGPDDIEIFDDTYEWFISIDHDGYVKYFKLI